MIKIIVATFAVFGILVLFCIRAKSTVWEAQQKYSTLREEEMRDGHKAATKLLQISLELEAHLKWEKDWQRSEGQFVERINEIEEDLRFKMARSFASNFDAFGEKLRHLLRESGEGKGGAGDFEIVVKEGKDDIQNNLDKLIEEFGDRLHSLGGKYLRMAQNEARKANERLEIVRNIVKAASTVVKNHYAGDRTNEDSKDDEDDDAPIDDLLRKLFKQAEKRFDRAEASHLRPDALEQIRIFHKDFDTFNAEEILRDLSALIYPSGRRSGQLAGGVEPYEGGSVEAYLEKILALEKYKKETWPRLEKMRAQWVSGLTDTGTVLREASTMVLEGDIPPVWILA
eukprot:g686.t1